jgi:hypothetical protein
MQGKLVLLLVQALWFCTVIGQTIEWNKLTADELSKISPEVFENVTAAEVEMIPPAACTGFQGAQITAMTLQAVRGSFCFLCTTSCLLLRLQLLQRSSFFPSLSVMSYVLLF